MKVLGIAGWSGSGKTTLIEHLLPALAARGLTVSTLKHVHHGFDVDTPGKDSWRHRQAGAREVLAVSEKRLALMRELAAGESDNLDAILARLAPVDLVLVEGYKQQPIPKIEVWRAASGKQRLPVDHWLLAVASDVALPGESLPVLALDDVPALADFIYRWWQAA